MGASASVRGGNPTRPLLMMTVINYKLAQQMKDHSAAMSKALKTHKVATVGTPQQNSKIFSLEKNGSLQNTLLEVVMPFEPWLVNNQASTKLQNSDSDPDDAVTVGALHSFGISCMSWVGSDAAELQEPAAGALRRRGISVATKLAGFCYGQSFKDCSLFIQQTICWRNEESMNEYVYGR